MEDKKSKTKIVILVLIALSIAGIVAVLRVGDFGTKLIWEVSDAGKWLLPLVAVAALLDSINPCAFSVLFLTIAFLFSIGKLRSNILKIGGSYIFGIFVVYILIGLGILQALHFFNTPHFMARLGALFLIALGLIVIVKELFPRFPITLKIPHVAHHKMALLMEKGSIPTAFALGVLVGLCEFPCTGGPYLAILGLLHDTATYVEGAAYLLLYNIIFVLPLVVILLIAGDKNVLEKVQAWQKKERRLTRLGGGIAMIVLGVIIILI